MKKTGAILLSVFLVMVMTVTNMAGAYQSAARVYAAQEDPDVDGGEAPAEMQGDTTVDGGEADNTSTPPAEVGDTQQDDGSNIPPTGGNAEQTPPDPATVLTMPTPESNTATPETLPQEVSPVPAPEIQTAPEQGEGILSAPEQENTSPTPQVFTVTFDANGHGSAPAAVSAEAGKSITKPNEPTAEGYTFCGWFRDTAATVVWNFDTDTVSENITLYAGWTENPPAQVLPGGTDDTLSTQGDDNTENNNAKDGITPSDAGNTGSTSQEDTNPSDAGNTSSTSQDTTPASVADTLQDDNEEETVTAPLLRSTAPALMAPLQNGGTRSGQLKNLTLRSDGPGTVLATGYSGVAGTKVSIKAVPEDGYRFLKWEIPSGEGSVDNPGSASTIFTFGATDTVVQAVFIEAEQNETYVVVDYDNIKGTATATVDPNDPTTFHLTATPAAGCSFDGWNNRSGTGTIQNVQDSTTTITNCSGRVDVNAHFIGNPTCPVTATANPTAGGTAEASWNNVYSLLDVDLKATPNAGYVFKEWRINSGTGAIRNPNEAFTVLTGITGNVSCEAVFEAVTSGLYSVSLEKNNPKGGEVTASVSSGSSGTKVTLTAAPASGFQFKKWEVSAGGVTINNPSSRTATFSIGSENVIVKAVFAEPGHSVTVTSEGGGSAYAFNNERMPGEIVFLNVINTTGVHFSHWEIVSGNITLANPYDAPTSFVMGDEAVEVKCVFVPENTYCVRITNDGKGAGIPSVPSGAQNETVTLTATPNPGYKFKEWIVIAKGGGTLSNTTDNPATFTIGTKHATLRATFAEDPYYLYAIVYHLDGGTNDARNPAIYTQSDTITLADPKKDGHTFGGWYDNDAFTGSAITGIPVNSKGDKELYAKWTLDTYNISYQNLKGASNSNPTTYTYNDTSITLQPPTGATGYTFDGWYDNAAFSGNAITEIPANSTGDKTFYAKWTADTYNISYQNVNGASNSNPATYTIADTPLTLAPLTGGPTGHTFDGWYDNAAFSGNVITEIPAGSTEDKTFYAKWTAVKYDVSVSASPSNGGTVTGGGTYADGDDVTVKASANTGYTFKHWTENGAVVSTSASYTFKVTAARSLTAVFESAGTPTPQPAVKQYSVTVKATQGGTVTGGGSYEENKSVSVTATANNGYRFVHWAYASDPKTAVSASAAYTFSAKKDVSLIAVFVPDRLYYTSGMNGTWQQGSASPLPFTTNGTYELFTHITVDGQVVAAKDFEAESGSTIIRLKAAFLKTLSVGTHTLETFYANGTSIMTQFTITAGSSGGGTPTAQPTATDGQNAVSSGDGTSTGGMTATNTNAQSTRSAGSTDTQNARMAQTGDDFYERLGLHTMILLAALLLLIANLRKVMEENALLAVAGTETGHKKQTSVQRNRKIKTRTKRTKSGLEFIVLDAGAKRKPLVKCRNKNDRSGKERC